MNNDNNHDQQQLVTVSATTLHTAYHTNTHTNVICLRYRIHTCGAAANKTLQHQQ